MTFQIFKVQLELAIRQKLQSTESFLDESPFLIGSLDYLCMENQAAQKGVLMRVFVPLRSLLLWISTEQSELTIRRKLQSTESFLIASPFLIASSNY